jgi:general secretion pathway protein G
MRLRPVENAGRAAVRAGFTLLELLVVIAIILVLIAVATPSYFYYLERSKLQTTKMSCHEAAAELERWNVDQGSFPAQGTWPPTMKQNPPLDAWKQPLQWTLMQNPQTGIDMPVVWSVGPKGNLGPEGELSSMAP